MLTFSHLMYSKDTSMSIQFKHLHYTLMKNVFSLNYLTSFLLFGMSDNDDKASSNYNYCCSKCYGCYTLSVSFLLLVCEHMLFHVWVVMSCAYSLPLRTFLRQSRTGAKRSVSCPGLNMRHISQSTVSL